MNVKSIRDWMSHLFMYECACAGWQALAKPDEFRLGGPPALDSDMYKRDYLEGR